MLFMQDACFALKYAHSKDIVHRDIKPGNILISKRGEIKLADFGIASDSEEKENNLTQTGVALGTPAYMPPEQFEDSANVDNRADIYALGIMLYEMVTGTKPYPGTFSIETLNIIKKGKYINPRKIDKTIPKKIAKLINKMIKPKAKNRYQNIDSVLKEVKKYLKHYDTHELRVQIAKAVLAKNTYEFKNLEPKDKIKQRIKIISISAISAILLFVSAWKVGLIHKTILSPWYTQVKIEMQMPKSLSTNMDLPIKVFFFENDGNEIPEVNGSERTFFVKGSRFIDKIIPSNEELEVSRPAAKNKTYTINTVYIKPGDYRAKVVVGPYVWWKSFSVTDKNETLECDFLKNMIRSIKIRPSAFDAKTGNEITTQTIFSVLINNEWKPLDTINLEELKSGTVWKIKAESEGYSEEIFSLLIDWFQDEIFVSASLSKN